LEGIASVLTLLPERPNILNEGFTACGFGYSFKVLPLDGVRILDECVVNIDYIPPEESV
jgi:hypothetical protein